MSDEPLTKEKEIDATAHDETNFNKTPGFLSSDVRSAVELLKEEQTDAHEIILHFMESMEKEFAEQMNKIKDKETKEILSVTHEFIFSAVKRLKGKSKNVVALKSLKLIESSRIDFCFPVFSKEVSS